MMEMRNKIIALGIVLVVLARDMLTGMLTGVQAQSSDEGLVAEWHFGDKGE